MTLFEKHGTTSENWAREAGVDRQAAWQIDAGTRSIVERIVNHRKPKRVILFGSRGRGNAREDSDVDLCVLYERLGKPNVDVMEELYLDLFEHMPHPVDLVVYEESSFIDRSKRPNSFESIIDAEGVTVHRRDDQHEGEVSECLISFH